MGRVGDCSIDWKQISQDRAALLFFFFTACNKDKDVMSYLKTVGFLSDETLRSPYHKKVWNHFNISIIMDANCKNVDSKICVIY